MKKRVAIFISGRGSNMAALIEAAKSADYPAEIALVLSNRPDAKGLDTARSRGIATEILDHRSFGARAEFDSALDHLLRARNIEIICLAGFMRIFTDAFVTRWLGRILNIHPSLLPAFKGLHVHEQALAAGVAISGCTVHFTVRELDSGPIIGQAAVPVLAGDTPQSLEARVLEAEHKLYPLCLRLLCDGKVKLDGTRAAFTGTAAPALWRGS